MVVMLREIHGKGNLNASDIAGRSDYMGEPNTFWGKIGIDIGFRQLGRKM